MLLLQDTIDFPIAFWGALRAGVVPVPINTLLTPDTVAYILAKIVEPTGVVVSRRGGGAWLMLPTRQAPAHRLSQPDGGERRRLRAEDDRCDPFEEFLATGDPCAPSGRASPMRLRSGFIHPARPGAPKGVRHVHGSLARTAESYGARCWALSRMT